MANYVQLESSSAGLAYQTLLTTSHMAMLSSGMVHDNVFNATPTWKWFNSKGRIKLVDGGERLTDAILYGKNGTAGWYSGYGLLNVTPQEGVTRIALKWAQAAVSVVYSGLELRSNAGKAKITDLVKTKQAQAESSLIDLLATGLFSDGSVTNQMTGLAAMHETTPGTASYASVPIANTVWVNQAQATAGAAATNLLTYMRQIYNKCSQGKGNNASEPDGIVTTRAVIEAYEALHAPLLRYASAKKGDIGFRDFAFKGAEMFWDAYCTSGETHFLNSASQSLCVHPAANLALTPFQSPADQPDGFIGSIIWQGQPITNNRRKSGKITGLT